MIHILLAAALAVAGGLAEGPAGLAAGGLLGYLLAEVFSLRRRLQALENRQTLPTVPARAGVNTRQAEVGREEEVVFQVLAEDDGAGKADPAGSGQPTWLDRLAGVGGDLATMLNRILTGGNPVVKIGLLVLFCGVAFLLKYAAQHNLLPIELRLIAAACGGLGLLGLGWRLRRRALGYGLSLQGGGLGILYLVVFAAAKLYQFIPLGPALVLMVGLVVFSGILAIIQDAKYLAIFAIVGGFLAPILLSAEDGRHVVLFCYYALLNCGVLGIAWYRAWRELNLLGFFFTFAVASLWGWTAYQPQFFATTEPFLILFLLFYLAIAVLFAHRQPIRLRGFIDGPLVFGLPLVVSGLQYGLVRNFPYGMTVSALALGLLYLGLAAFLWWRSVSQLRLLAEAFLALGIVFTSLAVPLALDGQWTSTTWALEGAAMVWVGLRQQRLAARLFGLLLQFGAAVFFIDSAWYPLVGRAFASPFFLGCSCIAVAALFAAYQLDRHETELTAGEGRLSIVLLVWGLLWWYGGGLQESGRHFALLSGDQVFLLFSSAGTMLMTILAQRLPWPRLLLAQLIFLPIVVLAAGAGLVDLADGSHLAAGWGWLVWLVALYCQYRLMATADQAWPRSWAGIWHIVTLWLVVVLLADEGQWLIGVPIGLAGVWPDLAWGLVPALVLLALLIWGEKLSWPVGRFREDYCGPGAAVLAVGIMVWTLLSLTMVGEAEPLPYLPILNPLELAVALAFFAVVRWLRFTRQRQYRPAGLPIAVLSGGVIVLVFLALTSVLGRIVHFYGGVPYAFADLFDSATFQAASSAVWSLLALAATLWATKTANRPLWAGGAGLLGLVVVKLFAVDLAGSGTVARIVSFLVVGVLMLIIGYFAPLPPKEKGTTEE